MHASYAVGLAAALTVSLAFVDAATAPSASNCVTITRIEVTRVERLGLARPVNMACHIKEPQAVIRALGVPEWHCLNLGFWPGGRGVGGMGSRLVGLMR